MFYQKGSTANSVAVGDSVKTTHTMTCKNGQVTKLCARAFSCSCYLLSLEDTNECPPRSLNTPACDYSSHMHYGLISLDRDSTQNWSHCTDATLNNISPVMPAHG